MAMAAPPCAAGLGFSLPLSSTSASGFALLFMAIWLLSGRIKDLPRLLRANPVAALSLLLLILFVVRMFGSSAPLGEAFGFIQKYRKLLLIISLIPFLADPKARRWGINGFFAGCGALLLVSGALSLGFLEPLRFRPMSDPSPISRITHGFLMAFAIFWAAHKLAESPTRGWPWAVAIVLGIFNIFFMVAGRTGQVIFVSLTLLFLFQRFPVKKSLAGVLALGVVLASFFVLSSSFSGRIYEGLQDVKKYQGGETNTSLGARYQFGVYTVRLWSTAPLLGHGTGSFPIEYAALVKDTKINLTDNPHNEYLLIAVQTGAVGLTIFLALLGAMAWYSRYLPPPDNWLAQGLVLTMVMGCLFNSCLLDLVEGHFFAFFTAMFFANLNRKGHEQV
jgi:O-antigen ligase